MKKFITTLLGVLFLSILISCSSEKTINKGQLRISAIATYQANSNKVAQTSLNTTVVLTSFIVNIKEIEFELAEDDDNNNQGDDDDYYDSEDEIELQGPFLLDILNQNTPIVTVAIPNGVYEEVEFEIDKNTDASSDMYNKSIKITGTIGGVPFVFWHDFEEEFEIDYEDSNQNLIVDNGTYNLVITFDVNQILSQVDLSTAIDGNNDGLIEISPVDPDGNQALAQIIKNLIKNSCELDD
jgi:hypothetical protein